MPYHFRKGTDTVYKGNEKIGTTGHSKEAHRKYMAALHIHSKDKKNENMEFDNQIGDIYAVAKPWDGCQVGKMVHKVDPMMGVQNMEPQQVHGFYPDQDAAIQVAEGLYADHMKAAEMLEEKKGKVGEKIKKAIDQLEKKRKEHIDMAKEDPKSAATHKDHIAKLAEKIDDLMVKLEKIEKAKKEIKKDEDKKHLKENKKKDSYSIGDRTTPTGKIYFIYNNDTGTQSGSYKTKEEAKKALDKKEK
jgi:hypothetical protein